MADIGSLIKQYLKVSPPSRRLNYYNILGLEEFSDDTGEILAAVEATVEKLKAIDRLADPSGLEQVINCGQRFYRLRYPETLVQPAFMPCSRRETLMPLSH
jgi:hypothetical protein